MKQRFVFLVAIMLFTLPLYSVGSLSLLTLTEVRTDECEVQFTNHYAEGCSYYIQGWIYLSIKGDPYDRGYQHGYLLAEEIVDHMNRWSNMIHNQPQMERLGRSSQESYERISAIWWAFCKQQISRIYSAKYEEYPEYKAEMQGIADGVRAQGGTIHGNEVTYEDVLALNEMYEFLSKLTFQRLSKKIHPLLTLYHAFLEVEPSISSISPYDFILGFIDEPRNHKCNGFIATGNATSHGQLVVGNSMWSTDEAYTWWWSYYITSRWSVLLDVNPTEGNRFMCAAAPGHIWSNHDYYQNDAGIVLVETTDPQGFWDNRGLPLAIRARTAIQYSNTIDDVVHYLTYRSDGCMNAVWLIGDTSTGEIARFELGYKSYWVDRTFNGFYWSANNPISLKVRIEMFNLKDFLKDFVSYHLLKSKGNVYNLLFYHPSPRDIKYEELGNRYYGSIDCDVLKTIFATDPIVKWSPDCKISDTSLVEQNGVWLFMGNPGGKDLTIYNIDTPLTSKQQFPPNGWVRIFGVPDQKHSGTSADPDESSGNNPVMVWEYDTGLNDNDFSSSGVLNQQTLYLTTSTGEVIALKADKGNFLWNQTIGEDLTGPVLYDNKLYIGTREGLKWLDIGWMTMGEKRLGKISCKPVIENDTLYVGTTEGNVYAFEVDTGSEQWHVHLPGEVYLSNRWQDQLFVASADTVYALHTSTGAITWTFTTGGPLTSRPYVDQQMVLVGSWDTYLYALNTEDGALLWSCETGWGIETTPIVSGTRVFFGSHDQRFYALDKETGNIIWSKQCAASIHCSPVVDGEYVVFGSDDGKVYALDQTTGEIHWEFAPKETIEGIINYRTTPIRSDISVVDGHVIIGVGGVVYSLLV
jgi:outer membrane protein assembly factor BamB